MTVLELITGRLARRLGGTVPAMTGLEAVNEALRVIGLELVRRKSDLAQQEISLNFTRGAKSQTLPDGFMGLIDHPVLEGGAELKVLPDVGTGLELRESAGTPEYYSREGSVLWLWPAPASEAVVQARVKIVPVLEMADDLPWEGLFNNLVVESAARLSTDGYLVTVDPAFVTMIDRGVSSVLVPRMNPLPRVRPISYF